MRHTISQKPPSATSQLLQAYQEHLSQGTGDQLPLEYRHLSWHTDSFSKMRSSPGECFALSINSKQLTRDSLGSF